MSGVPSSSGSTGGARRSRPQSSRNLRPHTSGSSKPDQPKIKSRRKKLDDTSKVMMDDLHENIQPNDNVDIKNIPDIDIVSSKKKIDSYTTLIDSSDDESIEKEAKRKTYDNNVETPADTTEIPVMFDQEEEIDHEADRLKQVKLDKSEIMGEKRMIEEKVMNSLQTNSAVKWKATTKPQIKSKKFQPRIVSDMELPEEFVQDLKYKAPKRYKPPNAGWATKRLHNYLEKKLEPKYSSQARVRAERLVMQLYEWVKSVQRCKVAPPAGVEVITKDFARLGIVTTYFDFYNFIKDYLPMEIKIKVVPDIMNGIPSPSGGVFSNILESNT